MKTWQLVLAQLWIVCFAPVWAFVLVFAPLALAPPKGSWIAFLLLAAPPVIALLASIAMWAARWKQNRRWEKRMVITLWVLPILTVLPLFVFE